jgi:tRNA pseudouridine38-40 synthase
MTRYRALIEYDGTNYFGFQRQREEFPTIQGELERVLSQLARQPVSITGAGRTDTGVHALGQVVSFTIEWRHGVLALQRALNANLPGDIAAPSVQETFLTFHPRFDARRRSYRYLIYNAPVRSPLRRLHSWHISQPLEMERMNEAAALLLGKHDFMTFGLPPQGENTVRNLYQARWVRQGEFLEFFVEANAFLYRMVRSLVGSLVFVGTQRWQIADFAGAFEARDRNRSAAAAPPQGLYLASITYEE